MCGLFGWHLHTSPPMARMRSMVAMLGDAAVLRGRDSWGFAVPGAVTRGVGPLVHKGWLKQLINNPVLMGHTRHATTGAVCESNAHPFIGAKFVLAHNGVVHNYDMVAHLKGWGNINVDSEAILRSLEETGGISELSLYGAYTYAPVYRWRNGIRMVRLSTGSLSVVRTQYGLVWSSTRDSAERAGERLDDHYEVYEQLSGGTVYRTGNGTQLEITSRRHSPKSDSLWEGCGWSGRTPELDSAGHPVRQSEKIEWRMPPQWCESCYLEKPASGEELCRFCLSRYRKWDGRFDQWCE